ncbi:hypothetical protein BET01_08305 [Lacrimispora algidixylanolytica]|uniref:Uncharacterized protein n=1 Tax=Lacrimispora algidixylanolytica TaxID=94868 RepID=A0A419SVU9_9FIRM|nr:hypothetical protein BET01_08305 [Lacrimispora algidixylanolytica]
MENAAIHRQEIGNGPAFSFFFVHYAWSCRYFWIVFYHFCVIYHINLILAAKRISKLSERRGEIQCQKK